MTARTRRLASTLLAASLLASLATAALPSASAATSTCTVTSPVEEGPFYLAGSPVRSNLVDGQAGARMSFTVTVVDSKCRPLPGVRVDSWQANAAGVYSGVQDIGDDKGAGPNSGMFLRGTQTTNAKGQATFTTVYPGWYPARTIHIHLKLWRNGRQVLTTQVFGTDAQNAAVMAKAPYNARGPQRVTNANDMVLRRMGSGQIDYFTYANGKASAKVVLPVSG